MVFLMNNKLIEYLIMATVIILLIYGFYSFIGYKYPEHSENVTEYLTMYYPNSSSYSVSGDTVEFRNSYYDFYDMDVSRLSSSDERIITLLNHYSYFNTRGYVNFFNETCYMVAIPFDDDKGFKYHIILIPVDSFDSDALSFKNETTVYLYDGKDSSFVTDSVRNSKVVI